MALRVLRCGAGNVRVLSRDAALGGGASPSMEQECWVDLVRGGRDLLQDALGCRRRLACGESCEQPIGCFGIDHTGGTQAPYGKVHDGRREKVGPAWIGIKGPVQGKEGIRYSTGGDAVLQEFTLEVLYIRRRDAPP